MSEEKKEPAGAGKMKLALCPKDGKPHWGNYAPKAKEHRCTGCGSLFGSTHKEVRS